MKSQIYRNVTCNQCNEVMEYDVFDSVNVTLNPILKDKMINDELFVLTCPKCGKMFYLSYPFTYNDMDVHYMIRYTNNENVDKQKEEFNTFVDTINNSLKSNFKELSYKYRIVNEYERLKEKVRIFDRDLDDRIIELYKYEFIVNGYDKELNNLDDIIFVNVDGSAECVFVLFEKDVIDNVRAISFDEMEYTRLEKEYEGVINRFNDFEIDLLWAQKVYNSVNINS